MHYSGRYSADLCQKRIMIGDELETPKCCHCLKALALHCRRQAQAQVRSVCLHVIGALGALLRHGRRHIDAREGNVLRQEADKVAYSAIGAAQVQHTVSRANVVRVPHQPLGHPPLHLVQEVGIPANGRGWYCRGHALMRVQANSAQRVEGEKRDVWGVGTRWEGSLNGVDQ